MNFSRVGHRSSSGTCGRVGSSSRAEGYEGLILFNSSQKYSAQRSRMWFLSLRRIEPSAERTGATVCWVGPYISLMELCFVSPPIILDLSESTLSYGVTFLPFL